MRVWLYLPVESPRARSHAHPATTLHVQSPPMRAARRCPPRHRRSHVAGGTARTCVPAAARGSWQCPSSTGTRRRCRRPRRQTCGPPSESPGRHGTAARRRPALSEAHGRTRRRADRCSTGRSTARSGAVSSAARCQTLRAERAVGGVLPVGAETRAAPIHATAVVGVLVRLDGLRACACECGCVGG